MNNTKNGIWQFEKTIPVNGSGDDATLLDTHTFIYEDDTLILKMLTISTAKRGSPDDVYRVLVKWQDNDLYLFPPFGYRWELFATWEDNRFIMRGGTKNKLFKKIPPEDIVPWNKELLQPGRQSWQYDRPVPDKIT